MQCSMYVGKLTSVLAAESGVQRKVEQAVAARLSEIWFKLADGENAGPSPSDGMPGAANDGGFPAALWDVPDSAAG